MGLADPRTRPHPTSIRRLEIPFRTDTLQGEFCFRDDPCFHSIQFGSEPNCIPLALVSHRMSALVQKVLGNTRARHGAVAATAFDLAGKMLAVFAGIGCARCARCARWKYEWLDGLFSRCRSRVLMGRNKSLRVPLLLVRVQLSALLTDSTAPLSPNRPSPDPSRAARPLSVEAQARLRKLREPCCESCCRRVSMRQTYRRAVDARLSARTGAAQAPHAPRSTAATPPGPLGVLQAWNTDTDTWYQD